MTKTNASMHPDRTFLVWLLRGLACAAILLIQAGYITRHGTYIIDVDECGYMDMIHEARAPNHSWLWNVRSYFYPLLQNLTLSLLPRVPGDVIDQVRVYQMCSLSLTLFAIFGVFALGRLLMGEAAGLCGAMLLGGNPTWIEGSSHVMMDAPFAMFVLLTLACSIRSALREKNRLGYIAASSLALGAACMTKFDGLVMIPVTGAFITLTSWPRQDRAWSLGTFAGAFMLALGLYLTLDLYYWDKPFESFVSFCRVNFIERWWTAWYTERMPVLTRLSDLRHAVGGLMVIAFGVVGMVTLWGRSKRIVIYLAVTIALWLGIRLGSYYYLQRFWMVLSPIVSILAGLGLAWLIERLCAARHAPSSLLTGLACMLASFLLLIPSHFTKSPLGLASGNVNTRQMLKAGSDAIRYCDALAKKQNTTLRVACLSPLLLPRSMFSACDAFQFYHVNDLIAANPQTFDVLLIKKEPRPEPLLIPVNFQETPWEHQDQLLILRQDSIAHHRIAWRRNADSFRIQTGGSDVAIGWGLWENGRIEDSVQIPEAGRYRLTIMACGAGNPRMSIRIGEQDVIQSFTWETITPDIALWSQDMNLPEGTLTLVIAYTNDVESTMAPMDLCVGTVSIYQLKTDDP